VLISISEGFSECRHGSRLRSIIAKQNQPKNASDILPQDRSDDQDADQAARAFSARLESRRIPKGLAMSESAA
jgi:hypothetical protein